MVDRTPLISVIIPTYNSAPFVERCLDSVFNQSLKDIELIAVDDMSTDDTVQILNTYSHKNDTMKVVFSEKKGLPGGARNLGLDRATGKYISFIDSDDWIDSNFLHYMVDSIESSRACVSVCGVKREYGNTKSSSVRYSYSAENFIDGRFALSLLSRALDQDVSISSIVCNKLFRADFLNASGIRFIEDCYNEDDAFMFEVFARASRVSLTGRTYYHLFQRRDSASRNFGRKHINDLFLAFSKIRDQLVARNQFETFKLYYYAFFEKCLGYLIESIRLAEQNDEAVRNHFKYAFSICRTAISIEEFVDYCGSKRIEEFFSR